MSIKPVDFQVMLPKTSEVSRINSDEQHKNQIFQQQQAAVVKHKAEDSTRRVYLQDELQQAKIRDKQEKDRENKKKNKKNNKVNYDKDGEVDPEIKTSTIDIRL